MLHTVALFGIFTVDITSTELLHCFKTCFQTSPLLARSISLDSTFTEGLMITFKKVFCTYVRVR